MKENVARNLERKASQMEEAASAAEKELDMLRGLVRLTRIKPSLDPSQSKQKPNTEATGDAESSKAGSSKDKPTNDTSDRSAPESDNAPGAALALFPEGTRYKDFVDGWGELNPREKRRLKAVMNEQATGKLPWDHSPTLSDALRQ